ncbi:MAG: SDR family oxidoreductase [Myxococcaceae bacterium]
MKLEDTVAVVTGAGSGIGRALVLELVRRGARVAAWDRNEKTLAETKSLALPSRVEIFPVDVSKRAQVDAALRGTLETFKNIDVVINNAGVMQPFKRLIELDDAAIDRVFGVNWQGTLNVTRATLPLLLGRPRAHLVNVSSLGGFVPVPGQTIYGASKAAVMLLTEGLNAELAGTNVGVTVVLPGVVATNILANSGLDAKAMAVRGRHREDDPPPQRRARSTASSTTRSGCWSVVMRGRSMSPCGSTRSAPRSSSPGRWRDSSPRRSDRPRSSLQPPPTSHASRRPSV